jgi:hypothetical protein
MNEPGAHCCLRCGLSQILPCVGREQRLKKPSFWEKLGFSCAPSLCVVAEPVDATGVWNNVAFDRRKRTQNFAEWLQDFG